MRGTCGMCGMCGQKILNTLRSRLLQPLFFSIQKGCIKIFFPHPPVPCADTVHGYTAFTNHLVKSRLTAAKIHTGLTPVHSYLPHLDHLRGILFTGIVSCGRSPCCSCRGGTSRFICRISARAQIRYSQSHAWLGFSLAFTQVPPFFAASHVSADISRA